MDEVTSDTVGAVGFCMGGGFVLVLAAQQGDRIGAAVPYYGVGGYDQVDLSKVTAPVLGHFGSEDEIATPEVVTSSRPSCRRRAPRRVDIRIHEGAGHAFFNDENHMGTYDAELARSTWQTTVAFLKDKLGG